MATKKVNRTELAKRASEVGLALLPDFESGKGYYLCSRDGDGEPNYADKIQHVNTAGEVAAFLAGWKERGDL